LRSVEFLGFVISEKGRTIAPDRVKAIENLRTPSCKKDVRCLLGMLNFIREFIPDCSSLTEPLSRLTKKDIEFVWGDEQEATFKRIKRLLKESPTLSFPEEETKLSLFTDASDVGIGAVWCREKMKTDLSSLLYPRHLHQSREGGQ
ncbi:unnamed protein product, partial [Aduncisulcus paluster]